MSLSVYPAKVSVFDTDGTCALTILLFAVEEKVEQTD